MVPFSFRRNYSSFFKCTWIKFKLSFLFNMNLSLPQKYYSNFCHIVLWFEMRSILIFSPRSCQVEEEPEDSDDNLQPSYCKTYKQKWVPMLIFDTAQKGNLVLGLKMNCIYCWEFNHTLNVPEVRIVILICNLLADFPIISFCIKLPKSSLIHYLSIIKEVTCLA